MPANGYPSSIAHPLKLCYTYSSEGKALNSRWEQAMRAELYGFKFDGKGYVSCDDGCHREVWFAGNQWGYTVRILGEDFEREGWDTVRDAMSAVNDIAPSEEEVRELVADAYDAMLDPCKLDLVRELHREHRYGFEWSDTFDLDEVLGWSSREELIRIIKSGNSFTGNGEVRYDKDGDLEEVSTQELSQEVEDNRGEIIDALIEVLNDGYPIYAVDDFDSIATDWMDEHEQLQQGS